MSRIEPCFARLRAQGRKALVPFVMAGDPDFAVTQRLMTALVDAGADIIELGVPFSDPMADGPVIQRAGERALAAGASLAGILELVHRFRQGDDTTPVVLMGYLNPVEAMGYEAFAARAAAAGVDGTLVVDAPPEEAGELDTALRARDIDTIYLVAPTTTPARMAMIGGRASGYLYYVSLKGITGGAGLDPGVVGERVAELRRHTSLPVGVGFGIATPEDARAVAAVADAVVVGTALVRRVEAAVGRPVEIPEAVASLLGEMRQAMDAA